jgi:hypothetical protein
VGPTRAAALLALSVATACRCGGGGDGGGGDGGPGSALWVGAVDGVRVDAVTAWGARATAASPPAIDAPVRALLALRDGNVLALQEPEVCDGGAFDPAFDPSGACTPATATRRTVPPGVLLDRAGRRVAALAALDAGGSPLFRRAEPPWAATQDASGRIWVTGRTAPVVYGAGGAIALDPAPADSLATALTRGAAALADGRVVLSYGVQSLAIYAADGTLLEQFEPELPHSVSGPTYAGIDALLALPEGNLLVGTRRFDATSSGVVLEGRLDPGRTLSLLVDPSLCATLGGSLPSALGQGRGALYTAPPLGRLSAPECGRWLSADLRADHGCVAPEPHRGAAWLE